MQRRKFIRDFEGGGNLDLFLITAIAAVLLIRLFLQLTGFPQLGGDTLHIAHMLWGGLLMLVAMIILLSFVSRPANKLAAVVGGAGFGTFIDEVGKFITQDNDYFFRPSLSIIYIVFFLTYLGVRWLHEGRRRTKTEYLVNALQEMQEVAVGDLDADERDRGLRYLDRCDPQEPLAAGLRRLLTGSDAVLPARPGVLTRVKTAAVELYRKLVAKVWFRTAVVVFFVGQLAVLIVHVFVVVVFGKSWLEVFVRRPIDTLATENTQITFFEGSLILFAALATVFVAAGIWQIRRSRLRAYQMFQRSILISICLVQPLLFYRDQWSALIGLTFDIVVFLALRFLVEREQLTEH
jgi:hypothetical protein